MSGFDGGFEIDGLTNGTEYSVTFRGVDMDDIPGAPSAAVTGTPYLGATAPGAPVVTVGPASITVSWTAATQGTFPIAGYTVGSYVQAGENGGEVRLCQTNPATLTCTVAVPPGYKYRVYVYAVDSKATAVRTARSRRRPSRSRPPLCRPRFPPRTVTSSSPPAPAARSRPARRSR